MTFTDFNFPSRVVIGEDVIEITPRILKEMNCMEAVIVTDKIVFEIVARKLIDNLSNGGVEILTHIIEDSTVKEVDKVRGIVKEYGSCTVIGLGGGKPIDVAKYSSYLEKVNFVSIPTSISHDGIASPIVALKDKDLRPLSIFTHPPKVVIADLTIISKAPERLLRSGFADIIGKITSVRDAYLAIKMKGEEISEYSLYLAKMGYRIAIDYAREIASKEIPGIRALAEAALTCGMAMSVAGSSRPCSGSEHLFSHALDKLYPEKKSLHGEQVGLGTILMAYFHGINWKKIKYYLQLVGAPTTAAELGIPDDIVVKAITTAHKLRKRYTILGENGVSEKAALRAAKTTGVIS